MDNKTRIAGVRVAGIFVFVALIIILLTAYTAFALTPLSVSSVSYQDGATNSWTKRFLITGVSQFEDGEATLAADKMVDSVANAQATKSLTITSGISSYTCEYDFVQPQILHTYYVDEAHPKALWSCSDFFKSDYTSTLPSGYYVYGTVKPAGFSCYAIIQKPYISVGKSSAATPEWAVKWKVSNGANVSQETTITSDQTNVVLRDKYGNRLAEINNFKGGLATKYSCPQPYVAGQSAVQNIGSNVFDLVDGRIADNALTADEQFFTNFVDWYDSTLLAPSLSSVVDKVRQYGQDPMSAIQNYKQNYLLGQGSVRYPVQDVSGKKVYDAFAQGDVRYPIIPLFSLEVQADFVGVIKPQPIPTFQFVTETVNFISGNAGKATATVGNRGTTAGNFNIYGTCNSDKVSVRDRYVSVGAGQYKTVDIYFDASTTSSLSTTCTVYAEYTNENKATDTITVSVSPLQQCNQGEEVCISNKVQRCVDNNWQIVRTCPGGTSCKDYLTDSDITGVDSTHALCISDNTDKCITDQDCKIGDNALPNVTGKVQVCINPVVGYNYCDYKSLNLEQCRNGIDDDGDGRVDLDDPGCSSATDNNEANLNYFGVALAMLGFIFLLIFGSLVAKEVQEDNYQAIVIYAGLGIISLLVMAWGTILLIGLFLAIMLLLSILLILGGILLSKFNITISIIFIIIGIVLLLTTGTILLFRLVDFSQILSQTISNAILG
jgi:hypothetical protein